MYHQDRATIRRTLYHLEQRAHVVAIRCYQATELYRVDDALV